MTTKTSVPCSEDVSLENKFLSFCKQASNTPT
eukprot:COSAG04_NODE_25464_length_307_cov_0.740385_2_plen_31_part_01